ncbi:MAG TPA: ATP-binding cassette domain-containing protein [Candidatus Bathyarchaeia archaeon]|nr:ATP-binding cassette domain-containing protein [Candidatus Bathyarchaeia archaeon]
MKAIGPIDQARDVKKLYRLDKIAVSALRGISFDAEEGEFITIFGPSSSGKSTLLNLIEA